MFQKSVMKRKTELKESPSLPAGVKPTAGCSITAVKAVEAIPLNEFHVANTLQT